MGKASRLRERDADRRAAFDAMMALEEPPVPLPAVPAVPSAHPAREMINKVNSVPAIALTVLEVCKMFNISRSTLYRANLPGKVTIVGNIRYDKNQLLAWWFEQQKKG
jgi:predicted DNA-binding transcriptional regulator AlpA